ncbi:von Willebrand factor type A domain-containing protein [Fusarium solani]|uniref:von Willebrand factor type A domain-containing protein n=1 Tax=Fusarium solani TaxID=169388 RepID=A0A9P9GEK8_FUSSL|nr:von Willebrand factor type A domain-containing protein [Fusarium solani]KAH7237368.1 von Willebrand factor type A domain-containing protein [Fusarium solani]
MPSCGCFIWVEHARKYLPQVQVKAHTTILATTSRTNLTQTFVNPDKTNAIDELRYIFPLYDGVSVVAFTCTVGSRVIKGVVKEREKAKQVYEEAKAQGEIAGLLEQSLESADVFTTTIGNVPAGEKIQVDITYLGELKHDAEVDGVRFTIPTHIVPRYGTALSLGDGSNVIRDEGIAFIIDAEMPQGSSIKSIQSPSHPISVNIGTTSTTESEEPSLRRASATLQQNSTFLEKDFIVQVVATNIGEPSAILETHPTIPNQRALMTTLVPKFKLPSEKPEIVFICDRSGSMGGTIPDLKAALEIFLKSLPVGVKFNICSFGSHFSFLWDRSQTYSKDSLDKALRHIKSFDADFGGTEMYRPVEATFKKRYADMNLEIFLLTDGAIYDQDSLFELINRNVAESKGSVRVFSLGIGSGASTSLVEGVARAGNGFAQTVGHGEKMDKKVIRMLKGALFPHITDYSLEIKYEKADTSADDNDEFELVEKVSDGLKIDVQEVEAAEKTSESKQPISLFNRSVDDDNDTAMTDAPDVDSKYDHLPAVPIPRYLQTPGEIPPLFPFNRTTVYVLLSDATPDQRPKSVLLKGTSRHGPLELEIPITTLAEKDSVIHRLAARKEVKELEEGRGWITHAKDTSGKLFEEKHEGHFSDLVEREAVRLGVTYQVGGKWCSFVAVEEKDGEKKQHDAPPSYQDYGETSSYATIQPQDAFYGRGAPMGGSIASANLCLESANIAPPPAAPAAPGGALFGAPQQSSSPFGQPQGAARGGLFGSPQPPIYAAPALAPPEKPVDDATLAQYQKEMAEAACMPLPDELEEDDDLGSSAPPPPPPAPAFNAETALKTLITLQTFSGSWSWSRELEGVLGVKAKDLTKMSLPTAVANHKQKDDIVATACAVVFFKSKLKSEEDTWEMLVEKAEGWLADEIGEDAAKELMDAIRKF